MNRRSAFKVLAGLVVGGAAAPAVASVAARRHLEDLGRMVRDPHGGRIFRYWKTTSVGPSDLTIEEIALCLNPR